MADWHLLRPYWLLSLIPVLLLCWALWRKQQQASSWRQLVDAHLITHLLVGETAQRRIRPLPLLLIIWILTAIALAGPTWRKQAAPFGQDQAGLMVVLKVSETMNATDVQPSRLERAKHKLRDLLELRKTAATGLIVYSGSAHLVMPLTQDDRIISAMIEDLTPELMPADGDALQQALQLSRSVFEKTAIPGSVLVMADAVAPAQVQAISAKDRTMPVQFLSLQSPAAPIDTGMESVASTLQARVSQLTIDQSDVQQLAQRAQSRITSINNSQTGEQWQDAGYALLPLIALFSLMWSRKGWVLP
ncbi:MAG: vWA domain-containing protein [Gammaproteobacteria bacterium]